MLFKILWKERIFKIGRCSQLRKCEGKNQNMMICLVTLRKLVNIMKQLSFLN